jgi:cation diffusion facilitator family transporter
MSETTDHDDDARPRPQAGATHAHDNHDHPHHRHAQDQHGHDGHDHGHAGHHDGAGGHSHEHRALKISLVVLFGTALIQAAVVVISNSVGLLGDTLHNFADAMTAIPLWIAFTLARRPANARYTYGYGRSEDLAGIVIVLVITASAVIAGLEAVNRLFHPEPITNLWLVAVAAVTGFAGNEIAAQVRIRTGNRIGSAALVADGLHARADGLTSLAVLLGAIGVALGFQAADPIVGLLIAIAIAFVVKNAAKSIYLRLMDAVDPTLVALARHAAARVAGVQQLDQLRLRWIGHRLHAEVEITVDHDLSLADGHDIAHDVEHELLHQVPRLSRAVVHASPAPTTQHDPHGNIAHHSSARTARERNQPA